MKVELDERLEKLTGTVIGAAFEVSGALGHGFLEAVYQNALFNELQDLGLAVEQERQFPVRYKGRVVGTYYADIVVEETLIVELKVAENLIKDHVSQVINYLRASDMPVGLLLNFGTPRVQMRRVLP